MWIKARLAPLSPYVGTLSFAFVGPPSIRVQLLPYNRVQLMNIPIIKNFLTQLLTKDLPGLMVLPKRLEIDLSPSVTAVAEAAEEQDELSLRPSLYRVATAVTSVGFSSRLARSISWSVRLVRLPQLDGVKFRKIFHDRSACMAN